MAPARIDDTVAQFKKEAAKFMNSAPVSLQLPAGVEPVLVQTMEKAVNGTNELLQLYQGGNKFWMLKARGEAKYFPARALPATPKQKKRVRQESEVVVNDNEDEGMDYEDGTPVGPAAKRTKAKKDKEKEKNTAASEDEATPVPSTRRTAKLPSAPKKKTKRTETVNNRRSSSRASPPFFQASYITVEEQLGRGKRRCTGRDSEECQPIIKEEPIDDLASLCGRVNGLEFMSASGEADSEDEFGGRTTPIASTSRLTADALATIV